MSRSRDREISWTLGFKREETNIEERPRLVLNCSHMDIQPNQPKTRTSRLELLVWGAVIFLAGAFVYVGFFT